MRKPVAIMPAKCDCDTVEVWVKRYGAKDRASGYQKRQPSTFATI